MNIDFVHGCCQSRREEGATRAAVKTGTDDLPFLQAGKSANRNADSNRNDFERFLATYSDFENAENSELPPTQETQKSPVSQGKLAEREGLGPSVQVIPYVGLASRCLIIATVYKQTS